MADHADQVHAVAAAAQVFKEIGGEEWSSMSSLRQCIGDPDSNSPSDIMDAEMAGQRGSASVRDQRCSRWRSQMPQLLQAKSSRMCSRSCVTAPQSAAAPL